MEEALRFFRAFELWIYVLLGLGGLIYLRKFILAWQELRGAVFGLERESAQARLNQAAGILVLLLTMSIIEFVMVSFIAPIVPGAIPLPTPTLNLLATATITLPASVAGPDQTQATIDPAQSTAPAGGTGLRPPGCIAGQIDLKSPAEGQEISGVVEVIGTANIPNFGFFKFEIKRPDETVWLTIQAGNKPVTDNKLGEWDTSRLTPGEYQLALVVVDNQGQSSAPCTITVRVTPALEPTAGP